MVPRIVLVVGYKKSGKTKIVESLVMELKSRGYRVGTIKHVPEPDFEPDVPGKDTWKHHKAGADIVAAISSEKFVVIERAQKSPMEAIEMMEELDFVIIEGFRGIKDIARIVVARDDSEISELKNDFTIAIIKSQGGKPEFDVSALADIVEQKSFPILPGLDCKHCGYNTCKEFRAAVVNGQARGDGCPALKREVILHVDGKEVGLNPFVQGLLRNLVGAIVSSLKWEGEGREVVLRVKRLER
ncbi:MAG: molybdopterin-guanine dinucleotide biosynthesis protein B [Candidatus Hadarchaeales archaeon]